MAWGALATLASLGVQHCGGASSPAALPQSSQPQRDASVDASKSVGQPNDLADGGAPEEAAVSDAGTDALSDTAEPDAGPTGDTSVCEGVSDERTKMGLSPREACVPVMRAYPRFIECFRQSATAKEGGGGTVTFLWTITPSGAPFQIRATEMTLGGDLDFIDCLRGEVGKLRFPKADRKTNMMWPFEFTPPKKKP